jgi:hypothetical protein
MANASLGTGAPRGPPFTIDKSQRSRVSAVISGSGSPEVAGLRDPIRSLSELTQRNTNKSKEDIL